MCISCGTTTSDEAKGPTTFTRRSILAGVGGAAAALGLSACGSSQPHAAGDTTTSSSAPVGASTKLAVVLLGTQSGPPVAANRAGISSALVVDGRPYVIDCGRASVTQYKRSGLKFSSLGNIFITHLHADHIADYYNYFMLGGSTTPQISDGLTGPVQVYGPGPAGGLSPKFGGGTAPVANPTDPTPGLATLTQRCSEAFAYSDNLFMRDTGLPDTAALPVVHEIPLPNVGATFASTHPRTAPFPVMSDDRVKVTATLVPHGPVFPSFAFRFDTEHGSVTFSGDTMISENLIDLARGSDVLVHEAINLEGGQLPDAARDHMVQSHTEVQQVGTVAQRAGAPKLVLTHMADFAAGIDGLDPKQWHQWAKRGYGGDVIVGSDLQTITVA